MNTALNNSKAATIETHSLGLIAASSGRITVKKIANLTNFSGNHIAKILQLLVKKAYLVSGRGTHGGYNLNNPAKQINLMEIYEL